MNKPVRIGSRRSKLALIQSEHIQSLIEAEGVYACEIITMDTKGDKILDRSLPAIGDKGLFTRELENELLDGRIDIAVHSLKDLPTEMPPGLALSAVTAREDVRDAFLSPRFDSFTALPSGARIATGSLRRRAQVRRLRPDLQIDDLRGNVPTRIEKMHAHDYDGIILAAAGLNRLGLQAEIRELFDPEVMIPAAGQGALGIQTRTDTEELRPVLDLLNHPLSAAATAAERWILNRLEGSCQVPIGVHVRTAGETVSIAAFVSDREGTHHLCERIDGSFAALDTLAERTVSALLSRGARELVQEVKNRE